MEKQTWSLTLPHLPPLWPSGERVGHAGLTHASVQGAEQERHVWTPLLAGGRPRHTQEVRAGGATVPAGTGRTRGLGSAVLEHRGTQKLCSLARFCFYSKGNKLTCPLPAGPLTAFWEQVGDRHVLASQEVVWEMPLSEQPGLRGSTRPAFLSVNTGLRCACIFSSL